MKWSNRFTELFELAYPVIQAPMLNVTTPAMVAAAADAGVLGALPLGLTPPDKAEALIREVKSRTKKSFSVNLFTYKYPSVNEEEVNKAMSFLAPFYERAKIAPPSFPGAYPTYEDLIELILKENIKTVSFTFGLPEMHIVEELRSAGVKMIATATSVEEAMQAVNLRVDAIVAQGIEAGGHRGTFASGELPETGLIALLPQIKDKVKVPVIAAGALMQGKSIGAAFMLGADAVQVGSCFLRAHESSASAMHKEAVAFAKDTGTVVTNIWTGRYGRSLRNKFINEAGRTMGSLLPYPLFQHYTAPLRSWAQEQKNPEYAMMWAGQSCMYAREDSTANIIKGLIEETEAHIQSFSSSWL